MKRPVQMASVVRSFSLLWECNQVYQSGVLLVSSDRKNPYMPTMHRKRTAWYYRVLHKLYSFASSDIFCDCISYMFHIAGY